jgi:hypothetical protein
VARAAALVEALAEASPVVDEEAPAASAAVEVVVEAVVSPEAAVVVSAIVEAAVEEAEAFPEAVLAAAEDAAASAEVVVVVAAGKEDETKKGRHTTQKNECHFFFSCSKEQGKPFHEQKEKGRWKSSAGRKGKEDVFYVQRAFTAFFFLARFIPPSYLNLVFSRHSSISLPFLLSHILLKCHLQRSFVCWQISLSSTPAMLLSI